ncbi:class I SAM-dependent methyltransferase [Streptacidiphilus sp. ASG 303]|uniref:SAM-dependent methyltransferase n=1 Tax=Streptacidiphilus sp. ASG 303 TaxID=2896847 RepID=UPI001E31B942|nr:class I SAM-dependent methyltransferase [Streptacidiphilus sp. ASG 303]MCD0485817.1 class I SAM-dependent methyltransferase [Streptacidiphilus sp. ASG 303]
MDRRRMSALAHAHHPIAAPLADASVARLLDRSVVRGDERALDLGCGQAEWLLRVLERHPRTLAEGVDTDGAALDRVRDEAARRGVADRLALHHMPAAEFTSARSFDVVLSVGATHAYGGLRQTLAAAREHLAPGGRVLVGEAFWEQEPDAAVRAELDGPCVWDDLPGTVDLVAADGWTPVYAHTSTPEEWGDYEWSWTGSLARWALDHPDDPDAADALKAAEEHRTAWLRGYRGVLGFVTLVLRRADT